jgi:hypothetical protein
MAIVAGFDVHRAQITWDAWDTDPGEVPAVGSTPRRPPPAAGWRAFPALGRRGGRAVHPPMAQAQLVPWAPGFIEA